MFAADGKAFPPQQVAQHPAAGERQFKMQFIDAAHERQVRLAGVLRPVVGRRTRQRQDLALPADRQYVMTVNHFFALSKPALVSAPLKKSFSKVNCPILA